MTGMVEFGPFRLDPANALLLRGNESLELAPKAFAVLCHLAQRPGQLVTKNDLLDAVWGHRFVSESVLKTAINTIRSALADDPRAPAYIETVARRGYRFIGKTGSAPPLAVQTPPPEASAPVLIGRANALAWLDAHLAAARRGEKQVALVAGEAGIGKSMLIERFVQQARGAGAWVATGQCIEQFGSGEPYLPVLDALALLCRGEDGAKWAEALRQVAPTWLAQLPWLVAPADQERLRGELAGAAQDRMVREFGALLDMLTPARTLLLVMEDLHWSDHATVNLLAYLARRRGSGNWMMLATYRPTDIALNDHPLQALRQELRLHRLVAEMTLDAFSEQDVDAYLRERFADNLEQHADLARELRAHTDGLPLFVANVVDELVASGALLQDADGRWQATPAALHDLRVPETIAGVVEKQIARLPGELRSLLEAASVIGTEFGHRVLAHALSLDADALQARCDGLARRAEWLNSAGMATLADGGLMFRYAFRHALYQRVFYERTEPAQRLQLHLRAAAALKDLHGGAHADRVAAELAVHFERAGVIATQSGARLTMAAQEAAAWRIRAARAAVALYAPLDALEHYERALAAEPDSSDRARVLAERAALLQQIGAGPRAMEESAQALALAREIGNAELVREVALRRARVCVQSDAPLEGIGLVNELLAAEPPLPRERRIEALLVLADGRRALGQMQDADAALQAAAEACGDDVPERKVAILDAMVMAHYQRGTIAAGLSVADEARRLYERIGDMRGAASMLSRIGVFAMLLGDAERAEAALSEARARTHELHHVDGERSAILNLVKLRTDRADFAGALVLLDEGWRLAPSFESPVAENAFLQGYYYCHYLRGNLGAALESAERVLDSAAQLNAVYWRVGAALLVFDLYVYLGDLSRAAELIDDAMARTAASDVEHQRPRAMHKRAWLDVLEDRPEQALARLADIDSAVVEQPEDVAAIARVRAQAQLRLRDPAGARATLARIDHAPTAEVWALVLALRLRAGSALGALADADLARAQEELRSGLLPRLEGAVLAAATADALQARGDGKGAAALRERVAATRAAIAATLAALPERQRRFLAAFPPAL